MDYKTIYIMKNKTQKTLIWIILAISTLLLVLVMVFPGERTNNISVLSMVVMIVFGLLGVIYATYKLKDRDK